MLVAFIFMPWLDLGIGISVTGVRLLFDAQPSPTNNVSTLWLILICAIGAIALFVWGFVSKHNRRTISRLLFFDGLIGLTYYALFFAQNNGQQNQGTFSIDATSVAGIGFWIALLSALGLMIQVVLPRTTPSPTTPKPGTRPRGDYLASRQRRLAMILLLPTFILLIIVAFYPLVRTFSSSFTDEPFARPEVPVNNVGLANYQRLLSVQIIELQPGQRLAEVVPGYRRVENFDFLGRRLTLVATDPDWIRSIYNTVVFTVISVALELLIGLGVALVVNSKFKGRGLMRAIMLVPWAIPTAISTVLWRHMLGDNTSHAMNAIFVGLGIFENPIAWRASQPLLSVILVDVWKTVPFMALLLLAGLQTISSDLYEAGAVDGATGLQRFTRITFPLLMPTIIITLIFRTLDALRAFDVFQVLLGRTTPSMAVYNYEKLVSSYQYGYASATGVLIFILIFAFTILYMSLFNVEAE